jgi:dATP/dGTP diphosphohydrolase
LDTIEILPTESKARKNIPVTTGVLDYFPAALVEVARVSFVGNEKHNPGQPLHWSRGKSNDHADAIGRHLLERGSVDPDTGLRHSAQLAWRALANLQQELEEAGLAPVSRGSK